MAELYTTRRTCTYKCYLSRQGSFCSSYIYQGNCHSALGRSPYWATMPVETHHPLPWELSWDSAVASSSAAVPAVAAAGARGENSSRKSWLRNEQSAGVSQAFFCVSLGVLQKENKGFGLLV